MRVGLQVPSFTFPGGPTRLGADLARIAENAERAGMDSLWVMDHFFQIRVVGPPEREMLEGWTTLGYLAGRTSRIRLGTMVTGVTYRHPGLLVKEATTLDVVSGGRAYLGIGAAWNEEEHRGLGVPFYPVGERMQRLEETLRIAHQMWRGDETPFEGRHFSLSRPLCSPAPVQKPHPPILVGGGGERVTLRLVARYADACNIFAYDLRNVRRKLDVLRAHCEREGRDYADIEKTSLARLHVGADGAGGAMSPDAAVRWFAAQASMGIDHAIVSMPNVHEDGVFDLLATSVIPAVHALAVRGRP